MELIRYIIFGILQGFTEPLPISSSGHLLILRELINNDVFNDLNFEIVLNFGSLIAILFIYWKDIKDLFVGFIKYIKTKGKEHKAEFKYVMLLVIATIPAGIAGLLFKDQIETALKSIKVVGICLLVTALMLLIIKDLKGKKEEKSITVFDAIIIGLFQMVALIPGISRSGTTLTGGMLMGLKRESALKFSFLLYIPVSIASFAIGVTDINNVSEVWFNYLIGMIAAGIMTYFATKWFINLMKNGKLIYFVIYCSIAGALVLVFM